MTALGVGLPCLCLPISVKGQPQKANGAPKSIKNWYWALQKLNQPIRIACLGVSEAEGFYNRGLEVRLFIGIGRLAVALAL